MAVKSPDVKSPDDVQAGDHHEGAFCALSMFRLWKLAEFPIRYEVVQFNNPGILPTIDQDQSDQNKRPDSPVKSARP